MKVGERTKSVNESKVLSAVNNAQKRPHPISRKVRARAFDSATRMDGLIKIKDKRRWQNPRGVLELGDRSQPAKRSGRVARGG